MDARSAFALALDPARLLCARGLKPDPWQRELLLANDRQVLLNCSRQSGKSTVVAALALHTLLFKPKALVLLLSPSLRQSVEIFRKVIDSYNALDRPLRRRVRGGRTTRTSPRPRRRSATATSPRGSHSRGATRPRPEA